MRLKRRWLAGVLGLCVFLYACGGGDGSGGGVPAAPSLPTEVAITGSSAAEVDTAVAFATSIPASTTGLTFAWNFGDGGTSADAAPSHTYAAGGEYDVALTVSNASGVSRSSTFKVTARRTSMVKGTVCSGAAETGWCWQRPKPTGSSTSDLFFIDASTGWAVGDAGQILKTTDGGLTWVGQRSNVTVRLTQVRFANASTGWAVGSFGTVLKTIDGGASWVAQASGFDSAPYLWDISLTVIDATRAVLHSAVYGPTRVTTDGGEHWNASVLAPRVVTANGTMWAINGGILSKSTDAGVSSTVALQLDTYQQFTHIAFADDNHGWAEAVDYYNYPYARKLWRTVDGGGTWQSFVPTGIPDRLSTERLRFTSTNVGWLLSYGIALRTIDGGASWTTLTPPGYFTDTSTAFDDNTVWLDSYNGGYLSRDGGATWTLLRAEAELSQGSARLQLIADGAMWLHYSQRSYRSIDGGVSWQRVFGPDPQDMNGDLLTAWLFNGKSGLAYSAAGWIVETVDAGQTWTRKTLLSGYTGGAARLQFTSATTGWLMTGGSNPSISVTDDAGASWWAPLAPSDFGSLADFHFVDGQLGWAIGSNGRVSHSADGGRTWTKQAQLDYYLNGIRFANATLGVTVGRSGILARTADAGATWTLRPSGVIHDLARVYFVDAQTAWAVGSAGTVIKSGDAGVTWSKVPVPSAESLNDIVFTDAMHGWIVGSNGTVLVTADGGLTWRVQASGTDKTLFSAFFLDALSGWLVGAGGTILATATGGH